VHDPESGRAVAARARLIPSPASGLATRGAAISIEVQARVDVGGGGRPSGRYEERRAQRRIGASRVDSGTMRRGSQEHGCKAPSMKVRRVMFDFIFGQLLRWRYRIRVAGQPSGDTLERVEPIDERLAARVDEYIENLFVPHDAALEENLKEARAAGLPDIHVSPVQGKLLYLIAKMVGARRILEIGTLGGYSTTWLARALQPGGAVITLELDAKHAALARSNIDRAGVGGLVEIRIAEAAKTLRSLIESNTEAFDLIFIDADKQSYPEYLELSLQLSRSGTVILADNLIRNGRAMDPPPGDANAAGARAYNEAIARDPRLDSLVIPLIREKLDGMSISIVR
jgi:caffeoyl-CoA O-methyltransferase